MATFFDILVDVSFIMLYVFIRLMFRYYFEHKKYLRILNYIGSALIVFWIVLISDGFGFFLLALCTIILEFIWCLFHISCWRIIHKNVFCLIAYVSFFIVCLFALYNRLKYEGIVEIEFIDKIEDIDIIKVLSFIIQNEWFKGIVIAASGAIIAGLVLNNISKKN